MHRKEKYHVRNKANAVRIVWFCRLRRSVLLRQPNTARFKRKLFSAKPVEASRSSEGREELRYEPLLTMWKVCEAKWRRAMRPEMPNNPFGRRRPEMPPSPP